MKNTGQYWPINEEPILTLKGEDRTFGGNELFVDLIPSNCWFTNVRTFVHFSDWDRLRNHIYERVDFRCECCNISTIHANVQLEAHERWEYNELTLTQKLVRLVALCH